MATYFEKLRDPRWQRRRLEIMSKADFQCETCEANDKTLNVHHRIYRKNADPWDYADFELACLCEDCHEEEHAIRQSLKEALSYIEPSEVEQALGYVEGLFWRSQGPEEGNSVVVRSYEHACGIGHAFDGVQPEKIIAAVEGKSIDVKTLYSLRKEHIKR